MMVKYSTQPCTLRADHHYSESLTEKWPKNPKLTNINALLIIRGFDSGFKMLEQNLVTLPLEAHTVHHRESYLYLRHYYVITHILTPTHI